MRYLTHGNHSRGKGGRRADIGNQYFRSRWEANWARYLNWLITIKAIKSWEYEPDTFEFTGIRRGSRFYTPDFKITHTDGTVEYHEVKGWMDQVSKTKLDRMKRHHPGVRIKIIDKAQYRSAARTVTLPGWETSPKHGRY